MKLLLFFTKHLFITILLCTVIGSAIQLKAQTGTGSSASLTIPYKTVWHATTIDSATNEFQLTPDIINQAGGVWSQTTIDLQKCFKIKAQLNFGTHDGHDGADGITFIVSKKNNVIGRAGGYLGYSGIKPSFAVEFDTYENIEFNDPASDHLAFLKQGSVNHTSSKGVYPLPNIETGDYYDATFTWDINTKVFTVNFLGKDYLYPLGMEITDTAKLSKVYFGFTAGTGTFTNRQLVKIISVENDCPATLAKRTAIPATAKTNELTALVSPNPAQSQFKMELKGGANEPVSVRIMDTNGKLIKTYTNLSSNQVLRFGSELQKGIYFAEVSQSNQRKVVKLVKL